MALADAINGYRLFLGRDPESERVAQDKASVPLLKMLSSFVGSREFSERVMRALASGYPMPHFRVAAFPGPEMLAWTKEVLPIAPPTRKRLGEVLTWRELLTHLVSDPGFTASFGKLQNEDLLPMVQKRQRLATPKFREREIAGWVDETSMFEIRGWATNLLNPDEPLTLEFFLDNLFVGTTQTTLFRRDVQERVGGPGNVGFSFNVPAVHHPDLQVERLLTVRDAVSRLPIAFPVRVRLGQTEALDSLLRLHKEVEAIAASVERLQHSLPTVFVRTEYPLSMYDAYQKSVRKELMAKRVQKAGEAAELEFSPAISVILTGTGELPARLITSINSLRRQIYRNWECMICAPLVDEEIRQQVETMSAADSRIRLVETAPDTPQWVNANAGLKRGKPDYVAFLKEGDLLTEDALYEVARAVQEKRHGLVYFDEDLFDREGGKVRYLSPVLKTAFDRDHLLSTNYIANAFVCSHALIEQAGPFRDEFGHAYEDDLLLRLVECVAPDEICYLERVLYHRLDKGSLQEETSEEASDRIACVNAHLKRTDAPAVAEGHTDDFGIARPRCQRIVWSLPDPAPRVSIIIPTRDRADLMEPCLQSVFESQDHYPQPYDIIVMDNESREPETHALFERVIRDHGVRVIPYESAFNWSAINNLAARHAEGEILVFLNNDTRVLSPNWIRELASNAVRPEVGAVGIRLLYEDGTVQHAGVVLGGRAVHEGLGERPAEGGYLGRTALQRNVSAVTAACMATRKDLFMQLGGFDEISLKVAFNDVDYCLKVRDAGLGVIYTPFTTLYHYESKSRGLDDNFAKRLRADKEIRIMRARWRDAIESDPFYNARFNRTGRPFSRLRPQQMLDVPADQQDDEHELWEHE